MKSDVKVLQSQVADVDFMLEAETTVTELIIEPKIKAVRSEPVVGESYRAKDLRNLPVDRGTIQDTLASQSSGMQDGRVRGSTSTGTATTLDDFRMNDVSGARGQVLTYEMTDTLAIDTAGYGAHGADAPGALIRATTRTGGNRYQGSLVLDHGNSLMQFAQDRLDSKELAMSSNLTLTLGGPIIRDRLWFFGLVEGRNGVRARPRDPTGLQPEPPRRSDNSGRTLAKLTFQATPTQRIDLLFLIARERVKNGQDGFGYDRDAQWKLETLNAFVGLTWSARLGDSTNFKTQAGYQSYASDFGPELCLTDPDSCDAVNARRQINPAYEYGNWNTHRVSESHTLEIKSTLDSYYQSSSVGKLHSVLTARLYGADLQNKESTPGDAVYVFDGEVPHSRRELFVNDPLVEPPRTGWAITDSSSRTVHLSLGEDWTPAFAPRLRINLGVGLLSTRAEDAAGRTVIGFTTLTPHLNSVWDPGGDGKSVLRASFNQYVDTGNLAVANFIGTTRTLRVCGWDPNTSSFSKDCFVSGGAGGRTVGLPCGSTGVNTDGSSCAQGLRVPRNWETTLGSEKEIMEGVSLGTDAVYRSYRNPYEDRETNLLWNGAGSALDANGMYRNGRAAQVLDLGTPAEAFRRYFGVTTSLRKREGKLCLNLAYTWSSLRGNAVDGFQNAYLNNVGQDLLQEGYLPGDSRHQMRCQAIYPLRPWVSFGAVYRYNSGTVWNPRYFNSVAGDYTDLRAQRGFSSGRLLNDPSDDFELRLPDQQQLDLQARFSLKHLFGINAEAWVDVLNLLALRTVTVVEDRADDPNFGGMVNRMPPLRLRVGLGYEL